MFRGSALSTLATISALSLTLAGLTLGQAPDAPDGDESHAVARISVMNGDVSVARGDSGELTAAAINAPVLAGDSVVTAGGSRAEIQFDAANMIRLAPDTEVHIGDLRYQHYQIDVARGTVIFRVLRNAPQANVEIATPCVSIRPLGVGVVRISVAEDGSAQITPRVGNVEVYTPRGSERLSPGRTMYVQGDPNNPEFRTDAPIPVDDFDMWGINRDRDLERTRSYQYMSPDIYGGEDLDAAGRWVDTPDYGEVWTPTVVGADWAPYRDGRWVWEDFYGWTWVSADPWGWAPYHYGRWFYRPAVGWCWWPGERYHHHYWSPALVAFFGFGGGGGIGFGFGNVGWVPLGPREPLYRWWGSGFYRGYRGGFEHGGVHIANNINVYNTYQNARVGNGVTGINSGMFGRGGFNRGSMFSVRGADLQRANLVRGQMPLAPSRESLRFSDRSVGNVRMASPNTHFFTRQQRAATERVPFDVQQRGMQQLSNRTFGANAPQAMGRGGFGNENGGRGVMQGPANSGYQRMGEQAGRGIGGGGRAVIAPSSPGNPVASRAANDSGFRRFGDPGPARGINPGPGQSIGAASNAYRSNTPAMDRGFRSFGDPGPARQSQANGHTFGQTGGGWSRFGGGANSAPAPQAAPRTFSVPPQQPQRSFSQPEPRTYSAPQAGGWSRFGGGQPGTAPSRAPQYNAPRQQYSAPEYRAPRQQYSAPAPREYRAPPQYSAPRQQYSAPAPRQYSAPQYTPSRPSYSAPQYRAPQYSQPSRPQYSAPPAPRSFGGGGGNYSRPAPSYSAPRSFGGGGGGGGYRASAPPPSHNSGGGGGGHPSGGGGNGHRGR